MKWYAKLEETGEIAGPMTEADALKFDGIIFNEGVFEQMQEQPPDVQIKLTSDLHELIKWLPHGDFSKTKIAEVCQRAVDMIYNLSIHSAAENKPPEELSKVVSDLQAVRAGTDEACRMMSGGITPPRMESICDRAIDAIHFLSRKKLVVGSIEGGVFSLGDVPEGVAVDIRDFDVEGTDALHRLKDDNGDSYLQVGTV